MYIIINIWYSFTTNNSTWRIKYNRYKLQVIHYKIIVGGIDLKFLLFILHTVGYEIFLLLKDKSRPIVFHN